MRSDCFIVNNVDIEPEPVQFGDAIVLQRSRLYPVTLDLHEPRHPITEQQQIRHSWFARKHQLDHEPPLPLELLDQPALYFALSHKSSTALRICPCSTRA